jgi:ApaG protein
MVETQTTHGIKISVETSYQEDYSKPLVDKFIFSYHITIENTTAQTVQLLSRHWFIFDSSGTTREVDGEGVVGLQPIIRPSATFEYSSWCDLTTDMGNMKGYYNMCLFDETASTAKNSKIFKVIIPEFNLIPNYRMS